MKRKQYRIMVTNARGKRVIAKGYAQRRSKGTTFEANTKRELLPIINNIKKYKFPDYKYPRVVKIK